ncbi:ERI1 exoribonuclease 2 [Anabarilius grahami]|uniref:ERI1 exoribonuclease 2 n=1 Tax=Anabarilius grahami TaxID=495550 RepID=A0A3N0XR59_ANAGA|nr:ERI1 exoribonuclease 2 [Anabarilius grahami]
MVSDGCLLTITKSLRPAPVRFRPPLRNTSCAASERDEPQASVCRALVTPRTVLSSTITPQRDLQETSNSALAGLSDTTYDPETPDACWRDGVLLTEEEEPGSYDDVPLGAEPDENRPHKTTSNQHKPSVSTGVFKTPKPLPRTDPHSSKRTAPLCGCGRRARRLTVGNGGPNHGRVFFCCPVRRQSCGGPQKGCDFFQWESGLMRSRAPNQLRTPQTCRALR